MPDATTDVRMLTFDLTKLRGAEVAAHAFTVEPLCEALHEFVPATAEFMHEALEAIVVELERRREGGPPAPVTVATPSLELMPTWDLVELQRRCLAIAEGMESEGRLAPWWRTLSDALVDEECSRMLNIPTKDFVQ